LGHDAHLTALLANCSGALSRGASGAHPARILKQARNAVDWRSAKVTFFHRPGTRRARGLARRLDITLRQRHALLSSEHRQQHLDALAWAHIRVNRQMPAKWPLQNPHALPAPDWGGLGELDEPVDLAVADLGNDRVRHLCWADSVHDQPQCPGRPTRGVPLCFDGDETVTREERRPIVDLAPETDPYFAQAGI